MTLALLLDSNTAPLLAGGQVTPPRLGAWVDWDGTGWTDTSYAGLLAMASAVPSPAAIDVVRPMSATWQRGVRADFSGDMTGACTIVLDNSDNAYTPDRNWCDNPSFETGVGGWSTRARGFVSAGAAATVAQDAPAGAGSWCMELAMAGAGGDGAAWRFPWRFRGGQAYSVTYQVRAVSGGTSFYATIGSASAGDSATDGPFTATGAWTTRTVTWTPTADRTDVDLAFLHSGAVASVLRVDAVQVNPGASANAYLEAPTKGMLVPGRPVLLYADWGPSRAPQFYGYVQRITPDPLAMTVSLLCHDQSQRLATAYTVSRPASNTYRRYRGLLLDDFACQGANLAANASFETDLAGVAAHANGALARVSTDAVDGRYSLQVTATAWNDGAVLYANGLANTSAGQTYTASFWARSVSGTTSWFLDFSIDPSGVQPPIHVPITVGPAWQRFSATLTAQTSVLQTRLGAGATPIQILVYSASDAGVILVDAVAVTAGPYLFPWQAAGVGRYPNLLADANSEFEVTAPQATTWKDPWPNLVTNGDFEDGSTRGWTPDGFTTLLNDGSASKYGGRSLRQAITSTSAAATTATVPGTFKAGTVYASSAWVRVVASGARTVTYRFGDGTNHNVNHPGDGSWVHVTGTWTPAVDTVGPTFSLLPSSAGTTSDLTWWDAITVAVGGPRDAIIGSPGGMAAGGCTVAQATPGAFGGRSMSITTPAKPGAAISYDPTATGAYFYPGRPYTVSFWHRLVYGSTDWRAAIGVGGVDEASVGFTPSAQWQRCAFTWWPSLEWDCGPGGSTAWSPVALAIGTPSGTGPAKVLIDSIRIEASEAASDIEPSYWQLDPAESDLALAVTSASASGSYGTIASALSALNSATLGRQALLPSMDWPYWRYRSRFRSTVGAQSVDEVIPGDFVTINGLERDESSAVNSQAVWAAASTYGPVVASDDTSIGMLGPWPGSTIQNTGLVPTQAQALDIAQTIVSRYRFGVARPLLSARNRFPSQTARDVGDLVAVTMPRGMVVAQRFYIVALQATVTGGGNQWDTVYTLEEAV